MKRKQIDYILLSISIISFLLLAFSFMLMPIESKTFSGNLSIFSLIAGLIFWISLATGTATQIVLTRHRKMWYVSNRVRVRKSTRTGVISFFKNAYATVADIALMLSLIGLIVVMVATHGIGYICYVFISLFIFSFSMHCILNGKNYYYVINKNKLLQTLEKE